MKAEPTEIAAQHMFSIRELVPRAGIEAAAAAMVEEVRTALSVPGVDPTGPPFALLGDLGVGTVELAAGLPTEFTCSTAYTRMAEGILPGGPVVVFTHETPFEASARAQMAQWIDRNGFASAATPWVLLDGSGMVVWPVRTVRDTAAFIARHGPRADLAGIRRLSELKRAAIGELISSVPERPLNLDSVIKTARALTGATHLLSPDNPQIARWLRLMARAGTAAVARCAAGGPLPPLDLDGTVVEVRAPGNMRHARLNDLHTGAMHAALATGDPVALGLLRQAPLDAVAAALGLQPGNWAFVQAQGLQALARGDRAAAGAPLEAALREAVNVAGHTGVAGLSGVILAEEVPVLELALAALRPGPARFAAALREALVAHRQWWAAGQANPGIPQDQDPQGFVAIGPLCFAALRRAAGDPVAVASDYLPASIIEACGAAGD
jgi:hypothetical protein